MKQVKNVKMGKVLVVLLLYWNRGYLDPKQYGFYNDHDEYRFNYKTYYAQLISD